jgi:hypothetical protein
LGRISFDCRSHEELRAKVSGKHMARPSSGDCMVERWTLVTREGVNTLLTSRASGSHKKGAQRLNNSSCEVTSSEKH